MGLRLAVAFAILALPSLAAAQPDRRLVLRDAMAAELGRSVKRLKLPGYESPYFVSYTVRDYDTFDIKAKLGAIYTDNHVLGRQAYVEVRVGSYQFDNTADSQAGGEWAALNEELYQPDAEIPLDDDADALRGTLWLLTDARYKAALSALNQKRGTRATKVVEDEKLGSFARAPTRIGTDPATKLSIDRAAWHQALRAASAVMKRHPDIFDSELRLQVTHETRYLVTSEGTQLIVERVIWGLHIQGVARAPDGVVLDHGRSFYGAAEGELPAFAGLPAEVERVAAELAQLRRAPALDLP